MGTNVTTAAGGERRKTWFDQLCLACHHYDAWLWTAYVWTAILGNLMISPDAEGLGFWVRSIPLLFIFAVALGILGRQKHYTFWDCERCNSVEIDAPAQAERHRKRLISYHDKWWIIALGVLALAVQIGMPFLLVPLLGKQYGSFALIPLWLFVLYTGWTGRLHNTLQPWCPICRRRDEGDDPIDVPAPTPPGARIEA